MSCDAAGFFENGRLYLLVTDDVYSMSWRHIESSDSKGKLDNSGRPANTTLNFGQLRGGSEAHGREDKMKEQDEEGWIDLLAEMERPKMEEAPDAKLDEGQWTKNEE